MECSGKSRLDQNKSAHSQISEELHFQSIGDETTSNFDLIPIFPNEITQGPLMACMPWYMKPQLMALNKSWAAALKKTQYATHQYKPYALAKSVIFYGHTPTDNDNMVYLRIYHEGKLRRLPFPADIPAESYKLTRFFVTDQCIYAFTPCPDQDNEMYNIKVLDLGGGIIKWQSLPSLPKIGEPKDIYISSIISEDESSTRDYIWMLLYMHIGPMVGGFEEGWAAWELHTTTRNGMCQSIPPPAAPPVENYKNQPPQYLDIYNTDNSRMRHLYRLFELRGHSLQVNHGVSIETATELRFLLICKGDYDQGGITEVHCIHKQVNTDRSMKLILYKTDLQNARMLKGEELRQFHRSWRGFLPSWYHFKREESNAGKFIADLSERMEDGFLLNERSTIEVAQEGTMYIYVYIGAI